MDFGGGHGLPQVGPNALTLCRVILEDKGTRSLGPCSFSTWMEGEASLGHQRYELPDS